MNKEEHRINLIQHLLDGKILIRKTKDSADQKNPEYWALKYTGDTIESIGFGKGMYPGIPLFLDFLKDPEMWNVECESILPESDSEKLEKLSNWIKSIAEPIGEMDSYRLGYLDKNSEVYNIIDGVETVENFR